jgi:hypothetical protein
MVNFPGFNVKVDTNAILMTTICKSHPDVEEGGIISLISISYMSNLKSFALRITIGDPHLIA